MVQERLLDIAVREFGPMVSGAPARAHRADDRHAGRSVAVALTRQVLAHRTLAETGDAIAANTDIILDRLAADHRGAR